MKQIALYSRVSTDKQEKGLEAQKRALEEYCFKNEIREYLTFEEMNISGAKASRPELDKLMLLVREGKISAVIVYSFSRFARSTKHLLDALEEFKKHGVAFTSLTEQIDTNSAIGVAFFTIIGAIAQLERELIMERVKNGMKNARAKGKQIGRPRKLKNEHIKFLLEDFNASPEKIAEMFRCSVSTILRRMKEAKIKE